MNIRLNLWIDNNNKDYINKIKNISIPQKKIKLPNTFCKSLIKYKDYKKRVL